MARKRLSSQGRNQNIQKFALVAPLDISSKAEAKFVLDSLQRQMVSATHSTANGKAEYVTHVYIGLTTETMENGDVMALQQEFKHKKNSPFSLDVFRGRQATTSSIWQTLGAKAFEEGTVIMILALL